MSSTTRRRRKHLQFVTSSSAHSAPFQSDDGTDRIDVVGIVMILWLVVVLAVNGWLSGPGQAKARACHEQGERAAFDEAHSGQFLVTALLTLTSAELIAAFPWEGAWPNGFPDRRQYCRSVSGPRCRPSSRICLRSRSRSPSTPTGAIDGGFRPLDDGSNLVFLAPLLVSPS